jgi:hypothetical protein
MNIFITLLENVNKSRTSAGSPSLITHPNNIIVPLFLLYLLLLLTLLFLLLLSLPLQCRSLRT